MMPKNSFLSPAASDCYLHKACEHVDCKVANVQAFYMQAQRVLSAVQGCKVHMQFGEARFLMGSLACLTGASVEFVDTG